MAPYIDGRYYAPEDWMALKTAPVLEDVEAEPLAPGEVAAPQKRRRSLTKEAQALAAIADAMGEPINDEDIQFADVDPTYSSEENE